MARYIVRRSFVVVLGYIWLPRVICSLHKDLSSYDVENIRAHGDGKISREAIEQWLTCNAGDFSEVIDFHASIEDGEETVTVDWLSEETESQYLDTLPSED